VDAPFSNRSYRAQIYHCKIFPHGASLVEKGPSLPLLFSSTHHGTRRSPPLLRHLLLLSSTERLAKIWTKQVIFPMILGHILAVLVITGAIGCMPVINHISLDQSEIAGITVKELAIVKRAAPQFFVATRANTAMAIVPWVGGIAAQMHAKDTGQSIALSANLSDPSWEIAGALAAALENKHGIRHIGTVEVAGYPSVYSRSTTYKEFSVLLDVRTLGWGISFSSPFVDQYRFFYHGHLQVIATEWSTLIAEGECLASKSPRSNYSYEQLLEEGAAKLKDEIQKVIQFCIKEFSEQHLAM
jgi:hypothetical protein